MKFLPTTLRALVIGLPVVLTACGGSDGDPSVPAVTIPPAPTAQFSVTVVNTTNNQPLSPIAIVLHSGNFKAWEIGMPASSGLEQLAESGSPADFLAEASSAIATTAGEAPVGPGATSTLDIEGTESTNMYISVASMLVNTNDAFTGIVDANVSSLEVGDYIKVLAPIYDAGTETNDELAAYIPGPAGGGEGYSAGREEQDIVTRHPGVVTQADGYSESALDESHRFDNGAMLITIVRDS